MSQYDEDQKKYNSWAIYFLMFWVGFVASQLFMTSSTEKTMKAAYSQLPKECQKVFDDHAQNLLYSKEAEAEYQDSYR